MTSASARAGAELRPNFLSRYLQAHVREVVFTLGRFYRNLSGALLTCFVIGITLALPAGLHCLVRNVDALGYSWETSLQASLFLKDSTTPEQGRELARRIKGRPGVADTANSRWRSSRRCPVSARRWICWTAIRFRRSSP